MAKNIFSSKNSHSPATKAGSNKQGSMFNKPLFSKGKKQELDVFDFEDGENLDVPERSLGTSNQLSGKAQGPKAKRPMGKAPRGRAMGSGKKKASAPTKRVAQPYTWFGKPLKGNLIAIDFDDHEVRILVARQRRQELEIINSVRGTLQDGIVHNGEIVDAGSLTDVIGQLIRTNRLDATYAFFAADNTNTIVRPVAVPIALKSAEDIEGAVAFELQQYLDIDPTSYNIEYQEVSEGLSSTNSMDNSRHLMVYAVPKRTIDQYLEISNNLKLTPYVFDLRSNSIEKWVERIESVNNRARRLSDSNIGIVQIKADGTNVYLYSKGHFVTSNHMNRGYSKIQQFVTSQEQLQNLGSISSGEVKDHNVKMALDEWLSDAGGHILNTENFFTTQTGEYVNQFYVFGDEAYSRQLTPILKAKLGREFESISSVDCRGIHWAAGSAFNSDFIPASAMLIRRSN